MPPLLTLKDVSLSYGHVALLDQVSLGIEPGERICLVGRNGTGKTSLLRVLYGETPPDDGEIWRRDGLKVARLEQDLPGATGGTVFDVVAGGLQALGDLLRDYHQALRALEDGADEAGVQALTRLQQELEAADGWRFEQRIEAVISKLDLPADQPMAQLSGGVQRRVLLARALVSEPDLLLLDEPTNHLDIDSILWLEEFLLGFKGALLFITHDRAFLQRLATRILELDRGALTSWPGDYANFLRRQAERLATEAEQSAKFDKKLAQEEAWIRQGIKARRTRNEGRVRALKALREERARRREQPGKARLEVEEAERSGKLVVEAEQVDFAFEGRPIVRDFSTRILRGDRIGLIGPNGVGKTSLVRLLLGELQPDRGRIRLGSKLQVAYFDQTRASLDPDKSVLDNLNQGRETVNINGRERHVMSYLQDFLFPPQRVRSPVKSLSGGERNRLLLARLFTRPANLLVLDEPTNDLDMETLELLEDLLNDYAGTLLLVSHDRAFLDNVVTSSLVFEGEGQVNEYVGGYADWARYRAQHPRSRAASENGKAANPVSTPAPELEPVTELANESVREPAASPQPVAGSGPARPRKLGYKEQRELQQLPAQIEALEQRQQSLQAQVSAADFYRQDGEQIAATLTELEQLGAQLEQSYARWEELEGS